RRSSSSPTIIRSPAGSLGSSTCATAGSNATRAAGETCARDEGPESPESSPGRRPVAPGLAGDAYQADPGDAFRRVDRAGDRHAGRPTGRLFHQPGAVDL